MLLIVCCVRMSSSPIAGTQRVGNFSQNAAAADFVTSKYGVVVRTIRPPVFERKQQPQQQQEQQQHQHQQHQSNRFRIVRNSRLKTKDNQPKITTKNSNRLDWRFDERTGMTRTVVDGRGSCCVGWLVRGVVTGLRVCLCGGWLLVAWWSVVWLAARVCDIDNRADDCC